MTGQKRKLIETALPLDAISRASAREKSIRHGHPSTLHLWWARRPLAAARAVLWASLVDDPSAHPDRFPTREDQAAERKRLFGILERLVIWENSNDPDVLADARAEIEASCDGQLPNVLDPFCGGGTIPLEAQRLSLPAYGGDLNPVAVLISKALVEIPPRFAGLPPVNPDARAGSGLGTWERAQGLAEDIGYYGRWMRDRAFERIGHLYPKVRLPPEEGGGDASVIAWIWARTVRSPDPAWRGHVPLVRSWIVRKARPGKPTVWVEPAIDRINQRISYRTRMGKPSELPKGTIARSAGTCVATGTPISRDYLKREATAGNMAAQLLAVVAQGPNGRSYVEPTSYVPLHKALTSSIPEMDTPSARLSTNSRHMGPPSYGLTTTESLFTERQILAISTFSKLLEELHPLVKRHACSAGLVDDGLYLRNGYSGATAYADAIKTYMSFVIDRAADRWSTLSTWEKLRETVAHTFGRQALSMIWDYAEANPFSRSSGNWEGQIGWIQRAIAAAPTGAPGQILQRDVSTRLREVVSPVVCTDPPYYDNVPYADLSDFFYVWLRRNISDIWPEETATMLSPKLDELVADPHRAGSKEAAKQHFEDGMASVLDRLAESQHREFPATIFYAFKQQETKRAGTASTGWETFLQALVDAGLRITATWPIRTEMPGRLRAMASSALASSIVIACRPRSADAPFSTRREFLDVLAKELRPAVRLLQEQAIAPVDMAQSAIGPGMEVFSRYRAVIEADGTPMPVRDALTIINEALEETLSTEEANFDAPTRWALTWYEQYGHHPGPFGDAETLSKAKNTAVNTVTQAGIAHSQAGNVRLLTRAELDVEWLPRPADRPTVWRVAQHLIARLDQSETTAAELLRATHGGIAGRARRLAYLLYQIADRKGRTTDAVEYNSLVQTWQYIALQAATPVQQTLETA